MHLSTAMRLSTSMVLSAPVPVSVTQRFIPGLHFEDVLTYQTCTEAGEAVWDALPLEPETPEDNIDDGAWWCARRCAAVLLRRPWGEMRLAHHLPAHPPAHEPVHPSLVSGAGGVAHALWSLLPGWSVVCHADAASDPVAACAPALLGGGSALLLLQSQQSDSRSQGMFWAWVVGLETRGGAPGEPAPQARALLTVPFGWPMPSFCGYAARVQRSTPGLCDVGGISGRWHLARCRALITLAAPPGDGGGDQPRG